MVTHTLQTLPRCWHVTDSIDYSRKLSYLDNAEKLREQNHLCSAWFTSGCEGEPKRLFVVAYLVG